MRLLRCSCAARRRRGGGRCRAGRWRHRRSLRWTRGDRASYLTGWAWPADGAGAGAFAAGATVAPVAGVVSRVGALETGTGVGTMTGALVVGTAAGAGEAGAGVAGTGATEAGRAGRAGGAEGAGTACAGALGAAAAGAGTACAGAPGAGLGATAGGCAEAGADGASWIGIAGAPGTTGAFGLAGVAGGVATGLPAYLPRSTLECRDSISTTSRKAPASQAVSLLILRPAPTPRVLSSWPPPPKALEMSPAPPCSRIKPMMNRHRGQRRITRMRVVVVTGKGFLVPE